MDNKQIARILSETADLMEIGAEDGFRIRSYRNAATAVEGAAERLADIARDPARKLTDIPLIGKGIAAAITEILARGSCEKRDLLLQKYPPTALEFLKIQGLGPKGIATLFEHNSVATMDDLERLCTEQKLRDLPRMGAKLEEKILRSIAQYRRSSGRFLLSFATQTAADITAYLQSTPGIEQITPAGSLRRGRETVGDLDLLVTGPRATESLTMIVKHQRVTEVLGHGENKASVRYGNEGLQVDVRALPRENYGAALQYFTGSKDHNVAIRTRAVKRGMTLNEYGLYKGDTLVASETEEQIYSALDLDWIPPEIRENLGEIERAEKHTLPRLLERADLHGDLHMHTRETDGRATLEEMAEAARAEGHDYIAITDHSKALAMANGLDEARAVAFAHRVREMDHRALGIRVFSGLECDILRDGALDLADDALAELDFVVASVHSHMNLEANEMTDRLLRALECPHVKALGHPTGRVLLHRDPYPYDFEAVVDAAVRRGVVLEINSSPERLDLEPALLRAAKLRGAKFVISTDAHHPKHLANLRYGVTIARRAWLGPDDILNSKSLIQFEKAIRQ